MEDIDLDGILNGETNNKKEILSLNYKKILYNCSECSSAIEITSINEDSIEFQCNNNHNIKISIKDFCNKMKKYNNYKLNNQTCDKHKKDYLVYCFDCKIHLCEECLKSGKHSYHYKINIIEIMPSNESLNKINEVIKRDKLKLKNLSITKIKTKKQLTKILNLMKNKIKDEENKKNENYDIKLKKELELNKTNYKKILNKLKEEYEKKISLEKLKYNENQNTIKNKYNILYDINKNICKNKIDKLNKIFEFKIESYNFNNLMDKLSNFNKLIEIIYNTYINYNNNYYNTKNINFIYNIFFNKDKKIYKLEEKHSELRNKIQNSDNRNIKNEEIKSIKGKKYSNKDPEIKIQDKNIRKNDKEEIEDKNIDNINIEEEIKKNNILEEYNENNNKKERSFSNFGKNDFEKDIVISELDDAIIIDYKKEYKSKTFKENIKKKTANYGFKGICNNKINIYENTDFIDIPIRLKNTGDRSWPLKSTKLVFDPKFDIKGKNIELKPLKPGEEQSTIIRIENLRNLRVGEYETGIWFIVDRVNYGNMIVFEINVKENKVKILKKIIDEFRKKFNLKNDNFSDELLLKQLSKYNFNFELTFQNMFQ